MIAIDYCNYHDRNYNIGSYSNNVDNLFSTNITSIATYFKLNYQIVIIEENFAFYRYVASYI